MQRGADLWPEGSEHRAQADLDSANKPLARLPDVPLAPLDLSAIYSSAQFVRYSTDGKDASWVSVKLDTCGHLLRVSSKEGESAFDIRKLRVR